MSKSQLKPGLTLIATPLGNSRDITLRALDALKDADVIACEDTRVARRLMTMHSIALDNRPILSYHEHNSAAMMPRLLDILSQGLRLVYMSDAGTPLVADPGFRLAQEATKAGYNLSATPGPCAAIMALTISGLPSDRFTFIGFAPSKAGPRQKFLSELSTLPSTLIFYESPHRLTASLADMAEALGPRDAAVARELTKAFEEVRRGTLPTLAAHYEDAGAPKGEIVILVAPPPEDEANPEDALDESLESALRLMSVKDAAFTVSQALKLPRRTVYERALKIAADL